MLKLCVFLLVLIAVCSAAKPVKVGAPSPPASWPSSFSATILVLNHESFSNASLVRWYYDADQQMERYDLGYNLPTGWSVLNMMLDYQESTVTYVDYQMATVGCLVETLNTTLFGPLVPDFSGLTYSGTALVLYQNAYTWTYVQNGMVFDLFTSVASGDPLRMDITNAYMQTTILFFGFDATSSQDSSLFTIPPAIQATCNSA